jgi:hypothetical protein
MGFNIIILLVIMVLTALTIILLLIVKRNTEKDKHTKQKTNMENVSKGQSNIEENYKPEIKEVQCHQEAIVDTSIEVKEEIDKPDNPTRDKPETSEEIHDDRVVDDSAVGVKSFAEDHDNWSILGASVIGKGHISSKRPCQDNHAYKYLGNGWGIAVVSDGAGTAMNSQIGSSFVSEHSLRHFESLIKKANWIKKNELPADTEWTKMAYNTLKDVRNKMDTYSQENSKSLASLSATVIVVIHSPLGMLVTHIGDGRAGYKNEAGEWKTAFTPHKGEEANQTIFITSEFWNIHDFLLSGVSVPESLVIREKPIAFTLMSDGCEHGTWQHNIKKTGDKEFYYDPNLPHPPFFNPVSETIQSFRNENIPPEERKRKWVSFINGGEPFRLERDDKTIILGVWNHSQINR